MAHANPHILDASSHNATLYWSVTDAQPLRYDTDGANYTVPSERWWPPPSSYRYSSAPPTLVPPDPFYDAMVRAIVQESSAQQRKEEPMRGLYEVYLVNPETGEVATYGPVVAATEAQAQAKALRHQPDAVLDTLDDYDVIIRRLGDVRPKRRPQEVKVTK